MRDPGAGYRDQPLRCPGCDEPMASLALGASRVDVCERCGGVWVDWHDGELRDIAAEAATLPPPSSLAARTTQAICPLCSCQLEHEARGEAFVLRCRDCVGAFVPREMVDALAHPQGEMPAEQPLERLVRFLFGWLGAL